MSKRIWGETQRSPTRPTGDVGVGGEPTPRPLPDSPAHPGGEQPRPLAPPVSRTHHCPRRSCSSAKAARCRDLGAMEPGGDSGPRQPATRWISKASPFRHGLTRPPGRVTRPRMAASRETARKRTRFGLARRGHGPTGRRIWRGRPVRRWRACWWWPTSHPRQPGHGGTDAGVTPSVARGLGRAPGASTPASPPRRGAPVHGGRSAKGSRRCRGARAPAPSRGARG